jgi:hypothetical protein
LSAIPPLTLTSSGPVPTPPATINQALIADVQAIDPDYTANLPGTLIEDLSSTFTMGLVQANQAQVDAVNSISPSAASPSVLYQLGSGLGIPQGIGSNTSVYVVFSGPAGYLIPKGFIVSDGTYQYVVQDGGAIATNGETAPLYCVATQSGIWTPAVNSVTTLVTSVPSGYTLTCTNPTAGTPGTTAQTVQEYRSQILTAQAITVQGTADYIKTLLQTVPGVNPRLIGVLQASGGWEVLCGGGDPYQVAGAIYQAVLDLGTIVGSGINSNRNITATITSPPNAYNVTFVNPPDQVVIMTVTWNTNLPNFTSGPQVSQLAQTALTSYINGIIVGQPINELEMTAVFQDAVASVLPEGNLTTLTFTVYINGTQTAPDAGTSIIPGDIESYFSAAATAVSVAQG